MRCGGLVVFGWALLVAVPCCMAGDAVPPHLGWVEDPRTTVTVSWQREVPGRGTVEYGLSTNYTQAVSDAGGHRRHVITLRDLTPGTLYHYRLSSTDG